MSLVDETQPPHRIEHALRHDKEVKQAANVGKEQKAYEMAVVVIPDAVVHPRAVVVHPQNTPAGPGAVVCARRFVHLARPAVACVVGVVLHLQDVVSEGVRFLGVFSERVFRINVDSRNTRAHRLGLS